MYKVFVDMMRCKPNETGIKRFVYADRIIIISLLILLIAVALFVRVRWERKMLGLDVISPEKKEMLCENLSNSDFASDFSPLIVDGTPLPYDAFTHTIYYASQEPASRRFNGIIRTRDADSKAYVIYDEYASDVEAAIREGHSFGVLIISVQGYAVYELTLTTLPIVNIEAYDSYVNNKHAGRIDIWNADQGSIFQDLVSDHNITYKLSESAETYTVRLIKDIETQNSKADLLGLGESKRWKLYSVNENDYSYIRSILSYELWNGITEEAELKRPYRLTEVICDNEYKGLFVLVPVPDRKDADMPRSTIVNHIETEDPDEADTFLPDISKFDNLGDLLVFMQYTGSTLPLNDFYLINEPDHAYYSPGKLEYGFGRYAGRYRYLEWTFDKIFDPEDIGLEDQTQNNAITKDCRDRWSVLRTSVLAVDTLGNIIKNMSDMMINSGYIYRVGRTEEEYNESIYVLTDYINTRVEALDLYYGLESETEAEPLFTDDMDYDYCDICLRLDNAFAVEDIKMFLKDGTVYYLMPSYADKCRISWLFDDKNYGVRIDGNEIRSGDPMTMAAGNEMHYIELTDRTSDVDVTREYPLYYMQSGNLPTVFIDTYSSTTAYINRSKENSEPGEMIVYDRNGDMDSAVSIDSVRARGRSSFAMAVKKSYRIKLEKKTNVLKMGNRQEYLLIANTYDESLIRNASAYELAGRLGMNVSIDYEFADVYFNGEYKGNYLITEVPTEAVILNTPENDLGELKVFSLEYPEEGDTFFTDEYGRYYKIRYPKECSEDECMSLEKKMNGILRKILECDTEDEYEDLSRYIDTRSFALMYIMDRLCNEVDSGYYSTYYYIDPVTGKLFAGPAWDYDRAWGNDDRARSIEIDSYSQSIQGMMMDIPYFAEEVKEIIEDSTEIFDELPTIPGEMIGAIESSAKMNDIIAIDDTTGFSADYRTETQQIAEYMSLRRDFLLDTVYNPDKYLRVYLRDRLFGEVVWIKKEDGMTSEIIDDMKAVYECDHYYTESGEEIEAGCHITDGMVALPDFYIESGFDQDAWWH